MEQLHNGFTLELCPGAFPLSTDSIALADFVTLPKNATVLDLGSGCGTLGLLLCSKDQNCSVTGIELDENAHKTALQNALSNRIPLRLKSICANAADLASILPAGSFSCCVSNPPYYSAGPASQKTPLARRDDLLCADELFKNAAWALRYGGDFFLVHKPEMMAHLCACGAKYKLEAKRLCLLRHKEDGPISLILLQLRKGAKPGLIIEEKALHHADGNPTAYYRSLYHLEEK